MSDKRYQESMTDQEAIEQEFLDYGFDSVDPHSDPSSAVRDWYESTSEIGDFGKLFKYLGEDGKGPNDESIDRFRNTEDNIERLNILRTMSLPDAVTCIRDYTKNDRSYRYLANRLTFYQKLFQGKATKTTTEAELDQKNNRWVDVTKEVPIDASNVKPETIQLGVLRDLLFAAMIGTPELGVFKIADRRLKENDASRAHMPELKGYHSHIDRESIGYAYPFLRQLYERARKSVKEKHGDRDDSFLEHKAVLRASDWLEEAMNYNDPNRGPESPYSSSIEEATAWARLGDDNLKAQLRGMRQKIQGVRLHNIERFIGKSAPNKYGKERGRLYWQIKNFDGLIRGADEVFQQPHLVDYAHKLSDLEGQLERNEITQESFDSQKSELDKEYDENKTNFLEEENRIAIEQQKRWYERESEKLRQKTEKSQRTIEQAALPEEERTMQMQSIKFEQVEETENLRKDYQAEVDRLKNRTSEQLLSDLKKRQELVEERYQKRKSLAQKAIDLHWIEGASPNGEESGIYNPVDWINYAPFGTIKRAHRMMRMNMKPEKIIKHALAEIICGKRGVHREDICKISGFYDSASAGNHEESQKLESMMKIGNIISLFGYEVSLDDIEQMAKQNFAGMTPALREYSLEEVRNFMNKGADLKSVFQVRETTKKFGHQLDNDTIAEMASHKIEGLEAALRSFDLESVRTFLRQDVHLPKAVEEKSIIDQVCQSFSLEQVACMLNAEHLFPEVPFQRIFDKDPLEVLSVCLENLRSEYALAIRQHFNLPDIAVIPIVKGSINPENLDWSIQTLKDFGVEEFGEEDFVKYLDEEILIESVRSIISPTFFKSIPANVRTEFFCSEIAECLRTGQALNARNLVSARCQKFNAEGHLGEEDQKAWQELSSILGESVVASFMGVRKARSYLHIAQESILKLYQGAGSTPEQFSNQILEQVKKDTVNYEGKDSYDLLNVIGTDFQLIETNIDRIKAVLREEADEDEDMKIVLETIEGGGVFTSWKILRKIYQIARQIEVLERIAGLRGKKKAFFQKMFLHPNISTTAVSEFLRTPEEFLNRYDEHSGETHERKKPSNYTQFDYLDLTAEELRDALVEGDMDSLQYFPPFDVLYRRGGGEVGNGILVNYVFEAIGKRSEGIPGKAQNPRAIFKKLNGLCKGRGLKLQDILKNPSLIPPELNQEMRTVVFSENGIKEPNTEEYRVQVHKKSSPEGLIAGDDTNCCMPFGSGKQNVYMYNLGCAQMTIQKRMPDGSFRTVAQSVLTPDIDLEQGVSTLKNSFMSGNEQMAKFVQKDLSQDSQIFVTADNIEVNQNHGDSALLKTLYSDFFTRYTSHLHEQNPHISKESLVIGKGYSDLSGFESRQNTYVPLIPPGYSDNTGDTCYALTLGGKSMTSSFSVQEGEIKTQKNPQEDSQGITLSRGVRPLVARDALKVSYLEGKIYADNETLIQYLHRNANHLIAKDISNTRKNRENLSLIIENNEGKASGYVIAYVGHHQEYGDYIYVADIASDNNISGGKIIRDFMNLVKSKYPNLPILAEARESTSYRIITRHAERYGYETEELEQYQSGKDTMHKVLLRPRTT